MLSAFPSLLTYGLVAPLIIRIVLGVTFVWIGIDRARNRTSDNLFTILGVVEIILGLLVFIGLFTQVAALCIVIILLVQLGYKEKRGLLLSGGVNYYLLLLAMALSLMFSGAGFFAFDLPL